MKTAGSILRETRESKGISLSEVETATKIRVKFLEAIERDALIELPSLSYAKGFIKNYSEFLGIDAKQTLMLYRREFDERKSIDASQKEVNAPIHTPLIRITPGSILTLCVFIAFIVFLFYLFH